MNRTASVLAQPTRRDPAPDPAVERASAALGIGRHRRPTVTGGQLPALTGLRGLAATLVFVRHAYTDLDHSFPGLEMIGNIGYAGVTFFFILSGFVLAWAGFNDDSRSFFWRRFARVYPLYFVAVWIWLGVAWHFGLLGEFGAKPISLLPSLLLFEAWIPDQSIYFGWGGAVLWSLSCEAFFYLAFPMVYRWLSGRTPGSRLRLTLAVVLPTSAVACVASFAGSRYDLAAYAFPGFRIGEFVLGVALGMMAREGVRATRRQRQWLGLFAYGWLLVPLLIGYDHGHRQGLVDTIALPSLAIIIFLLGTREADGSKVPVVGTRPMTYFGEVSYSFYLFHPAVIVAAVSWGWFETASSLDALTVFVGAFALAVACASLLHHAVEKPARVWLLRRFRRPPPSADNAGGDTQGRVLSRVPVPRSAIGPDVATMRLRYRPPAPAAAPTGYGYGYRNS